MVPVSLARTSRISAACLVLWSLSLCATASAQAPTQFGNAAIGLEWQEQDGHLTAMRLVDQANGRTVQVGAPFALTLDDGTRLSAEQLTLDGAVRTRTLAGDPKATRLAERRPRARLEADFVDAQGRFRIAWSLTQGREASYLREAVTITARKADEAIARVDLFDGQAPGAVVAGRVSGSPVVVGEQTWLQFESPLSHSLAEVDHPNFQLWVERSLPLERGKSVTYSAAVGTARPGQLRRDFQAYVEDQRPHPSRPFLHYNSWYDIGYDTQYTQAQALERIDAFCTALTEQRGVRLDSFLFDAGWDDLQGGWSFSKDFPEGFVPLKAAAARCGAAPGIWLSPWGGYDTQKVARVGNGKDRYETIDGGFALSGPRYYQRFHEVTMDLVTRNGVNQFKVDGFGNADRVVPGSRFDSDFDAAIQLMEDLRQAKPDLFINLTTGTYPSPAWLRYADTIWHGGQDHAFAGVGSERERWITYRDQQTYENIAVGGPLFPLNALMLHGIIYAQHAAGLSSDPGNDFANEVHSYFGTGTQLQELYITPSLLTPANWDTLADAARWARDNAEVLHDTHWIGGDPGRLEAYGWAAWSPGKSIVTLRNPDARDQAFLLDLARALELPAGSPTRYAASVRLSDGARIPTQLDAERPATLMLAPFEVVTIELSPQR